MRDRGRRSDELSEYRRLVAKAAAGEPSGLIASNSRQHTKIILEALYRRASQNVSVFTGDVDPALHGSVEVMASIRGFLNNPTASMQLIVGEPIRPHMPLIEALADNIRTGQVKVVSLPIDGNAPFSSMTIVDGVHYRFQGKSLGEGRAVAEFGNRRQAGVLQSAFDDFLMRSTPIHAPALPRHTPSGLLVPSVQIIPATAELITALRQNPSRLQTLSPEQFELLICDRLQEMGFEIHKTGHAFRPDGGVDIIARHRSQPFPALLAIQAKHSRSGAAVSGATVKNLKSVIQTAPFDAGLIVTNTTFTSDAEWWAKHGPGIIRLRNFEDVRRWIQGDFLADYALSEFPKEIQLGNVKIPIPRS